MIPVILAPPKTFFDLIETAKGDVKVATDKATHNSENVYAEYTEGAHYLTPVLPLGSQRLLAESPPALKGNSKTLSFDSNQARFLPVTSVGKALYDLTTQLDDFAMTLNVTLPVEGLHPDQKTDLLTQAMLSHHGALVLLSAQIIPPAEIRLVEGLSQVPIIGPFVKLKVLKLEMEPQTRQLKTRVKYLNIPFNQDIHQLALDMGVKKGFLSPQLVKNKDYNLETGLPLYSWQVLDLFFLNQSLPKQKVDQTDFSLLDAVEPIWNEGSIQITGDFSNRKISVAGLNLKFADKIKNKKHRIEINGNLTHPQMTINGLQSASLETSQSRLLVVNEDPATQSISFNIDIDSTGQREPIFSLPAYKSKKISLQAIVEQGREYPIRVDLHEGIEIKNLVLQKQDSTLTLRVEKILGKAIAFKGFGTTLQTEAGSEASLEEVKIDIKEGSPSFEARIRAKASGQASYFMNEEENGSIEFQITKEALGYVKVGLDENKKKKVDIHGSFEAILPELKLMVRIPKLKALSHTYVTNAKVTGSGQIVIWPDSSDILLRGMPSPGSDNHEEMIRVEGNAGEVGFKQSLYKVPEWKDELIALIGNDLAQYVETHLLLDIDHISFGVSQLGLRSSLVKNNGDQNSVKKPALEINKASMGPIRVSGSLEKGKLFFRMMGGYQYLDLATQWALDPSEKPRVFLSLNGIEDFYSDETDPSTHEVQFSGIQFELDGPPGTFSKKDAIRCGSDREHIHTILGNLFFNPQKKQVDLNALEHLHVVLRIPSMGGCLKVE